MFSEIHHHGNTSDTGLAIMDEDIVIPLIDNVEFDMPLFALWSPEKKNAPFICIEPWCGRCDAVDFEGTLEERVFGNKLLPDEIFEAEYTMIFN